MGKRIDNTVCHCLKMRRSAESVIRFYDATLAPSGVTARQYSLLNAVFLNKKCSIRVLADATLLDRSTLSRSLKPLLKDGLIADKKVPGSRDCVLELTQKGLGVYRQAMGLWQEAQRRFEETLGPRRVEALEELLLSLQQF